MKSSIAARPLEKLGIADDRKVDTDTAGPELFGNHASYPVGSAHRDGRFVDQGNRPLHELADAVRRRKNVRQVGTAIFIRRRTHGQENDVCIRDRFVIIRGEKQSADRRVMGDQGIKAGLEDRAPASIEHRDFVLVQIHAQDGIADIGKACA